MKSERHLIRWTAAGLLTVFLLVSGFQIIDDLNTLNKKQAYADGITLTACLPAQPQAAGSTLKFLKILGDFCFFETTLYFENRNSTISTKAGVFISSGPQIGRLLVACISINAP
jgi:hypothetical protein